MLYLPNIIMDNILSNLKLHDLTNIILVSKELDREIIKKYIFIYENIVINYFNKLDDVSRYYPYFIDSFIPMKLIYSLPVLKFKPRFVGSTDYIDRIRNKDLSHPIMVSVDNHARPFIVIRYKCTDMTFKDWDNNINDWCTDTKTLTIFQRYTMGTGWCKAGGGTFGRRPLLYGSGTLLSSLQKSLLIKNILRMLCEEPIEYNFKNDNWEDIKQQANVELIY